MLKSKIFVLALLVIMGGLLFASSCVLISPSFSSVTIPFGVADGSGGIVLAFQINHGSGRMTYAQCLSSQGDEVWGNKVVLYTEAGRSEGVFRPSALIASDGEGGTIFAWVGTDGFWATRLDSKGSSLWSDKVQLANTNIHDPKMLSDNSGGAIIAWSGGDGALYIQRIDNKGILMWSKESVALSVSSFDIAVDDVGSTLVVWEGDGSSKVITQKLSQSGKALWLGNGVEVSPGGGNQMDAVSSDKAGGAIVVWGREMVVNSGTGQTKTIVTYAQRVGADGKLLWQPDGVPVLDIASNLQVDPQMVADGEGGVIVCARSVLSILAQRIDSEGKILWGSEGVQIWPGEGPQSPDYTMVADGAGGVIVVWRYVAKGKRADQNPILRIQRLRSDGGKRWGDNGVVVSAGSWGYCSPTLISSDGSGGAIIFWTAGKDINNTDIPYIQKINAEGIPLWGATGIRLDH